jgi:hypothetical protein
MAEAPAGGPSSFDPQAAIAKHAAVTQSGNATDATTIARVESAIQHSPMGWLQSVLGQTESRASSEQAGVQADVAKNQQLVDENKDKAPKNAGPPPAPGKPAHPAVPQPSASSAGGTHVAHKSEGGTEPVGSMAIPGQHAAAKAAAPAGTAPAAAPAPNLAAAVAGAGGDDTKLDGILNAYTPKAPQSTAMIGRIKQMGDVAQGFNNQLSVYVAQGGAVEQAVAKASNFLGVGKDAGAVWANNPYRKMGGILGGIMTGLEAVKSVANIVGSIAGKLGLVLTVVGLLGMIFPPIGIAIEGIARLLNVIGIICEAITIVMSGILTGLNGVVLAKQIASNASAEEKAASADLMLGEANEAAGGLINLAMIFGPRFSKGLTANSKGIVAALFKRAKATIGQITQKISANMSGFANRIIRRMGFGGASMERDLGGNWKSTGMLANMKNSKAGKAFFSAPGKLEEWQDYSMAKWGNTKFARGLDRVGAWSGSAARKLDVEESIGGFAERQGARVGNFGKDWKVTKGLNEAAENVERDTRKAAMRAAAADETNLEEERWRRQMGRRQAAGNPDHIRNEAAEKKYIAARKDKIMQQREAGFELSEQKREATERLEKVRDARYERVNEDYANNEINKASGKDYRSQYMDRLHNSRSERYTLEEKFKTSEEERTALLAKAKRTAEENTSLTQLNQKLAPLDAARTRNDMYERDLSGVAAGGGEVRRPEYKNWHDVYTNAREAADSFSEMLDWDQQESSWKALEKYDLRKAHKYKANKGGAGKQAEGAGGGGTFGDIEVDARRENEDSLTEFVRASPKPSSVGTQVRSMLGKIATRRPGRAAPNATANAPVSAATAASPTPAARPSPVNAPTNATEAQPANAAPNKASGHEAVASPAVDTAAATLAAAPSPEAGAAALAGPAPAAKDDAAADAAAGDALPYWPSLLPEFDKATHEFGYMRNVAVEFRNAQITGKQKAVDTLAIYGQYENYAKLRQASASKNAAGAQQTGQSIQENVAQSSTSESSAAEGQGKQQQAQGAAQDKAATDLPEPEVHGFWDRIFGQFKIYVRNKAAAIFGWIQEQVASVILKGLCGVSMGDLKDYAGALRRQQQSAHGVAEGAVASSTKAESTTVKLGSDANKEAQSAADTISECDRNITDADQFMNDLSSFEQQLAEEKAHAQAFIAQLHAEVHAQQQRQRQAQVGDAANAGPGAGPSAASIDGPTIGPAPAEAAPTPVGAGPYEDLHETDPHDESAIGEVRAAAGLVSTDADLLATQLETQAADYQDQLRMVSTNRTGKSQDGEEIAGPAKKQSAQLVAEFKHYTATTKQQMQSFDAMSVDPSSTSQIADTIIQAAEQLDAHYAQSQQQLDALFSSAYAGIKGGQHSLTSRVLGGDNVVSRANKLGNGATDAVDAKLNDSDKPLAAPDPKSHTAPSAPGPVIDDAPISSGPQLA